MTEPRLRHDHGATDLATPDATALPTAPSGPGVETGRSTVGGRSVSWWARGTEGPPLVLVHGGGAHSGWWHPLLSELSERRRIVALDLGGHGDSDRAPAYGSPAWADEVAAVIRDVAGGRAVLVAHSMGGRVGTVAAARHPGAVEALVLVDAIVPTHADEPFPASRPLRSSPSVEAAIERFRIAPGRSRLGAEELRVLARRSIVAGEHGWTWKFDPAVFGRNDGDVVNAALPLVACPIVLIHGAESTMTSPGTAAALERAVGRPVPLLTVAGADHHVMLDAPAALAALLRWLPESRPTSP